jgi:tyrosyl-tRNA synthetase
MKSPKKIYLVHGGVLGIVLATTNTKNIAEFLAKSLTPLKYGLLVYEDGQPRRREGNPIHMAVDEFMPKDKKPKVVKHKWRNILTVLIEENYAKNERGAKQRIRNGTVFYNGQKVEDFNFKVDFLVPGVIKVGQYMKTIVGVEKAEKKRARKRVKRA